MGNEKINTSFDVVNDDVYNNKPDANVLLCQAYYDDKDRWCEYIKKMNNDRHYLNIQISILYKNLSDLTKWNSFWRKIFGLKDHKKELKYNIEKLEKELELITDDIIKTANSPPESWRYELAMLGNNLFKTR